MKFIKIKLTVLISLFCAATCTAESLALTKLSESRENAYIRPKELASFSDFRAVYIGSALLSRLKSKNAILLDTTELIRLDDKKGIYMISIDDAIVAHMFERLLRFTEFKNTENAEAMLIQKDRAYRSLPAMFLAFTNNRDLLHPGDIVILSGY